MVSFKNARHFFMGTYYPYPCEATLYATYGGIAIDENGNVVNTADEPIPGLFACGEAIGRPLFIALNRFW